MTDDGPDRFRCLIRIATAHRARPRQSPREAPQIFPSRTLAPHWLSTQELPKV